MKKTLWIGVFVVVVILIIIFWPKIEAQESSEIAPGIPSAVATSGTAQQAPKPAAPTTDYKNTTYTFNGQQVTLKGGLSVVKDPSGASSNVVTAYSAFDSNGDLNADGKADVAFIATQNSGGSGTFYYIVAALNNGASYRGTNAVFLGDRIIPQMTQIQDSEIAVTYLDRKTTDPMSTTPSVKTIRYFKLVGGQLVEVKK